METALAEVKEKYTLHSRTEGEPDDGWLLADFGDVVIHIFSPKQREYYSLEELWAEGKVVLRLQ